MAFTVLTEAFHAATALLLQQKDAFAVKMYIEYSTSSGYTTPTQSDVTSTADHNAYYAALNGTSEDYLRVDVAQFSRVVDSGHYQGHNTLPYEDNKVTFTGFTSDGGASGELGLAISGNYVYGAAVVLSDTSVNTSANDIIIARAYFDTPYTQVTAAKGASIQIGLNLVNDGACTGFGAGDIEMTAIGTDAETITIIDNAPTPVTVVFEFDASTTDADGTTTTSSGNIAVGTSGLVTAPDEETAAQLISAINGAAIDVTAVINTSDAAKVDVTQDYCGTGGNTTIATTDSTVTVSGFIGGA